jgi:hypothetical protein
MKNLNALIIKTLHFVQSDNHNMISMKEADDPVRPAPFQLTNCLLTNFLLSTFRFLLFAFFFTL